MGFRSKKLRTLVSAIKDRTSLGKATFLCPAAGDAVIPLPSPEQTVLRATAHQPSTEPPGAKQIAAFLTFGRGSRLSAAAAVAALTTRLSSTRDAAVALKCLVTVHYAIRHGGFILQDQLLAALRPSSSRGGRNPLNLSAFRDGSSPGSWTCSTWVRWYARVIELLLAAYRAIGTFPGKVVDEGNTVAMHDGDLVRETEALVAVMEEIHCAPVARDGGNGLVAEVVRLVEEDRAGLAREVLVRMRELGERASYMEPGRSVEVGCLIRRMEECCRGRASTWVTPSEDPAAEATFWEAIAAVGNKVGRGRIVTGKSAAALVGRSESARISNRVIADLGIATVRFGSSRWADLGPEIAT